MFKTPNMQIQICTRTFSAVDWKQNPTSMELKTEFNKYGIENRIQQVWNWKQNSTSMELETESESYKTTNICLSESQSISLVPYSKL
jgi:hypothetical protein